MPQEKIFELGHSRICAQHYEQQGGIPTIALHGWLDNCASFHFLQPELEGLDLLAIDMAGHGESDPRPSVGPYNIWSDLPEILAVAKQMSWERFALIGHSRGAMVATLLAATFPEKVSHLCLIEAVVPIPIDESEAPLQLRSSMLAAINGSIEMRSSYETFDAAVAAREKGFIKLCHEDALVLAKRGVKEDAAGYYWNYDRQLNLPSEVKFTVSQIDAFMKRVEIPARVIKAKSGLIASEPRLERWLENHPQFEIKTIAGEHHLHMSESYSDVAKQINDYIRSMA